MLKCFSELGFSGFGEMYPEMARVFGDRCCSFVSMPAQFDDQRLATGGEDSNIRVWTYGDGKCHVLNGHTDSVWCGCAWQASLANPNERNGRRTRRCMRFPAALRFY
jgi:hypothetical protein